MDTRKARVDAAECLIAGQVVSMGRDPYFGGFGPMHGPLQPLFLATHYFHRLRLALVSISRIIPECAERTNHECAGLPSCESSLDHDNIIPSDNWKAANMTRTVSGLFHQVVPSTSPDLV